MTRLIRRAIVLLAFALPVAAQAPPTAPVAAVDRAASFGDVHSIDAIITALYASISGPKDAPRDFERLRTLFGPNARMTPTGVQNGKPWLRSWSVEQYIAEAGPGLVKVGFFEREIGRTTTSFGNVWHIMSAYDSRNTPEAPPFARGVNSIQLFNSGERWYIMSVLWDSERAGNPIPPEMTTVRPHEKE